jgi:hypothetical protein
MFAITLNPVVAMGGYNAVVHVHAKGGANIRTKSRGYLFRSNGINSGTLWRQNLCPLHLA